MTFKEKMMLEDEPVSREVIKDFLRAERIFEKEISDVKYDEIKEKYDKFIQKYYYTRREVAHILWPFICDNYPDEANETQIFKDMELKIELMRFIQGNQKRTRGEIAEEFFVGEGTINNSFTTRTDRRSSTSLSDFSFLGENISIEVDRGDNCYNKQTITPVFMGMSLGEIYAIMKSLLKDSEENMITNLIHKEICKKIYIELSDYGRSIIQQCLKKEGILFECDSLIERMKVDRDFSNPCFKKVTDMRKLGSFHFETTDGKKYSGSLEEADKEKVTINCGNGEIMEFKYGDIVNIY